jgi:hypothetical protein
MVASNPSKKSMNDSFDIFDFKPGPMGRSGLGQLAHDSATRIFAASHTDDVALESERLKQGLLMLSTRGSDWCR